MRLITVQVLFAQVLALALNFVPCPIDASKYWYMSILICLTSLAKVNILLLNYNQVFHLFNSMMIGLFVQCFNITLSHCVTLTYIDTTGVRMRTCTCVLWMLSSPMDMSTLVTQDVSSSHPLLIGVILHWLEHCISSLVEHLLGLLVLAKQKQPR